MLTTLIIEIFTGDIKGRRQKKNGTFGWCPPQSGDPPPSPSCGEGTNFFCRKIFLGLESPETEKKFIRLESEIFTPL